MQRIECEIPLNCELFFSSCQHIGSWLCNYHGIQRMVDAIKKDKKRRLFMLGDVIEAITTDDKRYNTDSTKIPIPAKQKKEAEEIFGPISDHIDVVLGGNHELKLHRYGNLAEEFAESMGAKYGTRTARVVFTHKGKILFKAFLTHDVPIFKSNAKSPIQKQANILAAMRSSLENRMADCAMMICGHPHQLLVLEPSPILYLTDGEKGVKQHYLKSDLTGKDGYINPDQRWYGCAGSFRKKFVDGMDDYADIYDPVELGYLVADIKDGNIDRLRKVVA